VTPALAARGVSKRFGGTHALRDVTVEIAAGTVHALVGENGAGKSTLGRILGGALGPDAGEVERNGAAVRLRSPRDAQRLGVTVMAQELAVVPGLSVLENVFLGVEGRPAGRYRASRLRARYAALCEQASIALPEGVPVGRLSVADQQKVEILRALARDADVIVMDEPTAALGRVEAGRLVETVRGLRERGVTVVYVSHFLEEILAVSDVVTILRDGAVVRTAATADETVASLVDGMVGAVDVSFPPLEPVAADAPVVLDVAGAARPPAVHDVSLEIRRGEIVGLAGLVGSGRTELARLVYGADRRQRGEIRLHGRAVRVRSPREALREGIALLPESRKDQGLVLEAAIRHNMSLPHLASRRGDLRLVGREAERRRVDELVARFGIRAASTRASARTLSGGNQQKVVLAKCLYDPPAVLIADEPTRGVDVGAKRAIYESLRDLAASGMAILLISSEIEEVLGLSHRILVMKGGRLVGEFDGASASADAVMRAAFGAAPTVLEASA
jgi:simple sugar transport system ATP-binding protein/ribose transport system ATP-binding protein